MKVHDEETCSNSPRVVSFQKNGSLTFPFQFLAIDDISRNRIFYDQIPQEPFKLTILKLDGSTFGIDVVRNGTVGELKKAVEAAFSHLAAGDARDVVSWSHVWGHFCLSYNGNQLLTDSDCIERYGIKDGDQLAFTRQGSIKKLQSEGEEEESVVNENRLAIYKEEEEDEINEEYMSEESKSRLVQFLRKWFSYRRIRDDEERGWDGAVIHHDYALLSQEV